MHRILHLLTFLHKYWGLAVCASTDWDSGIFRREAHVVRNNREETQRLAEAVLEILTALDLGEGDIGGDVVGAEFGDDGCAQFLEDGGMAGEQVEEPAEQRGSGVAASKEDVEELAPELNGISCLSSESFEEDVFVFLGSLFTICRLQIIDVAIESDIDIVVDELMANLIGRAKGGSAIEPVLVREAKAG